MKIIELKSTNVKRLKAVQVIPRADDPLVVVGGANGQGKSSLMDSILFALAGGRNIPALPVREGQKEAVIEVDLGEYKVTRKIKADGTTTLTIRQGKGAKVMRPQEVLNDLIGSISFDPEEFSRMGPQDRRNLLVTLANVDTAEIDGEIEGLQFQLGEAKTDVKVLQGMRSSTTPEADPNWDLVDISDLQSKLNEIKNLKDERATLGFDYNEAVRERERAMAEIARLQEVVDRAQGYMDKLQPRIDAVDDQIAQIGDEQEMQNRLATAAQQNEQILAAQRYAEQDEKIEQAEARVAELSEAIKDRKATRVSMIEQAEMPIDGLSFDEKQVLFDGIPFDQLASSEQLRISMAMAMAMNPELRVIRIMNGALLDDASLEIVRKMAGDRDYQVWVEVVGERGDPQVVIEDGSVR